MKRTLTVSSWMDSLLYANSPTGPTLERPDVMMTALCLFLGLSKTKNLPANFVSRKLFGERRLDRTHKHKSLEARSTVN